MREYPSWRTLAVEINADYEGADTPFQGVSHDTRTLQAGQAYIAIKGERLDGHDYITEAIAKGASVVIVQKKQTALSVPQLIVSNTLHALGQLARVWRTQFQIPIIGITGSVGKTTTKQLTGHIFASVQHTLMSQGNWNNQIGLPLNILQLRKEHQIGVFELGTSEPGEIAALTNILQPTIAAVTAVAPAHVKGFGSVAGIANEKSAIFSSLPVNGIALAPLDEYQELWRGRVKQGQLLFCGFSSEADYSATDITLRSQAVCFTAHTPMGKANFEIPLAGQHNIMNALFAIAIATQAGVSLGDCQKALLDTMPVKGRLNFHKLSNGITLIDDSYNANPTSVKAAMEVLANQSGRKVFVFGDMAELDSMQEIAFHEEIGQHAKDLSIDVLYTYGNLAKHAAMRFGQPSHALTSHQALIEALSLQPGDVCLIKGSRCNQLDKVVVALLQTQGSEL
jgi:UDP-N-acetylmuramoyl-tripeptide--D-alanyl-D-alanine ligase